MQLSFYGTQNNVNLQVVRQNEFVDNFIGIYHEEGFISSGFIFNNHFTSSGSGLLPVYPGYTPHPDLPAIIPGKSYAGMYLNCSDKIKPELSISNCTFDQLAVGLLVEDNFNLISANNTFEAISRTPNQDNYPRAGTALFASGNGSETSSLSVNTGGNASNNFNNCREAIAARNAGANIQHTAISDCRFGIRLFQSPNILVSNNQIDVFSEGYGIDLQHNDLATSMVVTNNTILVESPAAVPAVGGRGISINEMEMRLNTSEARIEGNDISIESGYGAAILVNSASNLSVTNHPHINLMGHTERGIQVDGSQLIEIADNNIIGLPIPSSLNDQRIGILTRNTPTATFSCNYLHHLADGIRVAGGMSNGALLKNNIFDPPLANGVHYEDNLLIGRQSWHGNEWRGSSADYSNKAAFNEITTNDQGIVNLQLYDIEDQTSDLWPPSIELPNYAGSINDWINPDDSKESELCSTDQLLPEALSKLDEEIIRGLGYTAERDRARMWDAERILYERTIANDSPLSLPSSWNNYFHQTISNNNVKAFTDAQTLLKARAVVDAATADNWRTLWEDKWNVLVSIQALLPVVDNNPTDANLAIWDNYQNDLATIDESLADLMLNLHDVQNEHDIVATASNATLSVEITAAYEQNEQETYAIYLASLLQEQDLSEAQATNILAIAEQCPLTGGRIVHKAQSLYHLVDPFHQYEASCDGIAGLRSDEEAMAAVPSTQQSKATDEPITLTLCTFAPNPIHDQQLQISSHLKYDGVLKLVHPSGKLLTSYPLPAGASSNTITLPPLPSGLYWLQWLDGKRLLQADKLIIH